MRTITAIVLLCCISAANAGVVNLRCEYLKDPLGIDVVKPRLSWELQSTTRGEVQKSVQIIVASSKANIDANIGDLWNTTINSDQSFQVEYGGTTLQPEMSCYWKVKVTGLQGSYDWSAPAFWTVGLLGSADWSGAKWIGADAPVVATPSPLLRKSFTVGKSVKRAMVYVTSQGAYELHLNGRKVGDQILAPGWTEYRKRIQYQTFDVTADLNESGENVIGAILGDGWYNAVMFSWPGRAAYGNNGRKLLLKLSIECTDGTKTTIVSDESWKMQQDGFIRSSDIYGGETMDFRKLQNGWEATGFNDGSWSAPKTYSATSAAIVAQKSEPIRVEMNISPVKVTQLQGGGYIFDMGQNMVGWCKLKIKGVSGQTITLRHGEMLNPDGTLYTDNLRTAAQKDVFTLNGVDSIYEPHFTYHGFRYVEVTGLTNAPPGDFLTGRVFHSDASATGSFTCSNTLLNKIWTNTLWGQRGNHMSIPTDCPQRDERMGWMGDAQIFAQTAIFNWSMAAFYSKWVQDIRDDQSASGAFQDYVPAMTSGMSAPAWGDAGVIVPWKVYLNYNDLRLIKEHYASAKKWVDLVNSSNPNHLWINNRGSNYSDWLDGSAISGVSGYPSGGAIPSEVFSTAFFYNSTVLVAKMASAIGLTSDATTYTTLANAIKAAFNTNYVNSSTGVINGNSQSGYALALNFDLLPDSIRLKAATNMNNVIVNTYGTRISTGFNTTLRLMMELTRWGYNETAYKLAESKRMPSWGYSIDQGATTMWERWDGWVAGRGFQTASMNSFNHYSFGSVCEWFYRVILGINWDEAQLGYKHFFVKPQPGGTVTSAEGGYSSISGEIHSKWTLETNGVFTLNVKVPGNTTADISIPKRNYTNNWVVRESKGSCWQNGAYQSGVDGITSGKDDGNFITFTVGSGDYSFQAGSKDYVGIIAAPECRGTITRCYIDALSGKMILHYSIAGQAGAASRVRLRIFDLQGRCVAEPLNTLQNAGVYKIVWKASNRFGNRITDGTYLAWFQVGEKQTMVKRLMVVGR